MNTGDSMNIKIKLELHEEFICDDDKGELMDTLFSNGTIKLENEVKKELREEFANEIDDNTKYLCELCTSYFPNLSSLQDHMQNHDNFDEKMDIKSFNNSVNHDAMKTTDFKEASEEGIHNEKPDDKQEEKCNEKKIKRKRQRTEETDDRINLNNNVHENDKPGLVNLIMKDHLILRIKHHDGIVDKASLKTMKEETEDINENDNNEIVNLIMKDHIILKTNNHAEKKVILKAEASEETSRNSICDKTTVHAETLDRNNEMNVIDAEYDDKNKEHASKDSKNRKRRKKPVFNELAIESIPSQSHKIQLDCNLCKKSFATSNKLKIHISNSHKRLSVFCDVCSKKFSRKEYLDQHVKRDHLGIKQEWKCKFCGNIFTDNSNLRRHTIFYCTKSKKKVLGKDMKPKIINKVGCEICRRKYVNQEALEAHMAHHPKYICDYCDKIYYNRRYLELHIKRHHLNMKYRCKKCGNEYVTRFNLNRHLKIHPQCDKNIINK